MIKFLIVKDNEIMKVGVVHSLDAIQLKEGEKAIDISKHKKKYVKGKSYKSFYWFRRLFEK